MRKMLYPRLAATNLKKNAKFYVPYIIACTITVMMFCIVLTLQRDAGLEKMSGGSNVRLALAFGCIITAIFSAVILFYTSSVLIKQRKKEFGLYNILGMEKRHIGRMLLWETIYTSLIALCAGLVFSVVFSKILQLLLMRILNCDVKFGLNIDPFAMGVTALLYAAMFAFIYLRMRFIVHLSNPVELLRGSSEGEREPKSKWLLALLGVVCLGGGYAMAILAKTAFSALTLFFVAVLLVIAGTYLIFTAFSIVMLKGMKKNRAFYYKTRNFATVSGMLYRMKRNAAGLASICILSTMVLVTISTTVCLYAGTDDILNFMYPHDLTIRYSGEEQYSDFEGMKLKLSDAITGEGVEIEGTLAYRYLSFVTVRDGDSLIPGAKGPYGDDVENAVVVYIMPVEDYNRLTGNNVSLSKGEALCCTDGEVPYGDRVTVMGLSFETTPIELFQESGSYSNMGIATCYLVVDSYDTMSSVERAQILAYDMANGIDTEICFDLSGSDEQKIAGADAAEDVIADTFKDSGYSYGSYSVSSKQVALQEDFYSFYGAFFFLGLFLGFLFVVATVLIIYYKQISEGYDDAGKFEIMQKVGMTKKEVKATIRSQILIVFFLPLVTAAVHIAFAFPMITRILGAFSMTNVGLFAGCTLVTLAIFALLYTLVYSLTAKAYYGIVNEAK